MIVVHDRWVQWEEYFSGQGNCIVDGELHEGFEPLEVRVLLKKRT